jgi:hypothetical protein
MLPLYDLGSVGSRRAVSAVEKAVLAVWGSFASWFFCGRQGIRESYAAEHDCSVRVYAPDYIYWCVKFPALQHFEAVAGWFVRFMTPCIFHKQSSCPALLGAE